MDIKYKKTKKEILELGTENYIDLYFFTSVINKHYSYKNLDLLKNATFELIKDMLEKNLVKTGDLLLDNILKPWNMSVDEIIAEIKFRWNNLGRELHMYEWVWFEITEEGRKEFEYLNSLPELIEFDLYYLDDK